MRRITIEPAKARTISWKAYLIRALFGGLATLMAALIGQAYGPVVGGLFLAFPSIAVASLTLIESDKGKNAAGADAAGTSVGSLGLLGFGLVVWMLARQESGWLVLVIASVVWFVLASGLWLLWWRLRHPAH
jgi:uncharacterized membrane protein (GlpM family)